MSRDPQSIAILGANGQVGRGLAEQLAGRAALHLYGRRPEAIRAFAGGLAGPVTVGELAAFGEAPADLVINAAGPGDPRLLRDRSSDILRVTEALDRLVLDRTRSWPGMLYVYLSTGALYGPDYRRAEGDASSFVTPLNRIAPEHLYPIAKFMAEVRHRTAGRWIADVRIFGYVSRHLDLDAGFLLSELARCLRDRVRFTTTAQDFMRDYIDAPELAQLILQLYRTGAPSGPFDLLSAAPISKLDLIALLRRELGLEAEVTGDAASGPPHDPFRLLSLPAELGWRPTRTSAEIVTAAFRGLLA